MRKLLKEDRLLYGMLLGFLLLRLAFLSADPSGPYIDTDEGLHNNDARSIVLYGTPFHDAYNPSVLMPVFTWVKVPFLALMGVNQWAVRLPSVLACMGAAWLLCLLLERRGERLGARLLLFYLGASYFYFAHSRLGIHEPVLALFSAGAVYLMDRAFETGRASYYVGAALAALAAPLVKTAGVFVPGSLGAAVLVKLALDRPRVSLRGLALGLASALACGALLYLLWFRPHWAEAAAFYAREVSAKRAERPDESLARLLAAAFLLAPLLAVFCAARAAGFVGTLFSRARRLDDLDLLLLCWLVCAAAPLAYSGLLFWRWLMWLYLPLAALGARECARLIERAGGPARARLRGALIGTFAVLVLGGNLRGTLGYFGTLTFYVRDFTPTVERLAGDSVVSGSGFDDFSCASAKLDLMSSFHQGGLSTCAEVERAFPDPGRQPRLFSIFAGGDPARFDEKVKEFSRGCPVWKARFKPFKLVRRLNPPGTADLWLAAPAPASGS